MTPLWYIVHQDTNGAVSFMVGQVLVSPYLFSTEGMADAGLHDGNWPDEIAGSLVVRPGPHQLLVLALEHGFPNTKPRPPDAISINSKPGNLLSGLIPLTPRGAELVDEVEDTTFWSHLAQQPGALMAHAREAIEIAVGVRSPH